SLLCILFVLRWLLRPYQQLVGEAQRASMAAPHKSQDEAEFVLETFQSVVAQLQEQRKELEKFSERIVASLPSGLIAFDGAGLSMAINTPGRELLEVNRGGLGHSCNTLFG